MPHRSPGDDYNAFDIIVGYAGLTLILLLIILLMGITAMGLWNLFGWAFG